MTVNNGTLYEYEESGLTLRNSLEVGYIRKGIMPSVLDMEPFSQPEWSDSSDSSGPAPLPQLGYFVPFRCRWNLLGAVVLCRNARAALEGPPSPHQLYHLSTTPWKCMWSLWLKT
ncbi:hypothetical protein KGM_207350 [Danaus plexippus plexippus]|uniref:Uncharacterized protein n=1 Tax=Danaus plexippus plexippus TaxID=278856 RepID=A0A212EHD2_DANPL|nr:hypothetical protein KGM_207350 [Danaus plexippus plexippus]